MRRIAIVLVAIAFSPGFGQAQESLNLPKGHAPVQVLAGINADGKLVIKHGVIQTYYVPITTTSPDGKSATTAYEQRTGPRIQTTTIDKVRAHDVRGNPIAAKRLRKILREETPVLLAIDGKAVDPLHLRLYKEDVVILMMPMGPGPNAVLAAVTPPAPREEPAPLPAKIAAAGNGGFGVSLYSSTDHRFGLEHRYFIEVDNNSDGKATNAKAFVYLPKGVTALATDVKYQDLIMTSIGDIERGQLQKLDLNLRATRFGTYEVRVLVTADSAVRIELKFQATFAESPPPPGVNAPPSINR